MENIEYRNIDKMGLSEIHVVLFNHGEFIDFSRPFTVYLYNTKKKNFLFKKHKKIKRDA